MQSPPTIQIRIKNDTVRHIYNDSLLNLAKQGDAEVRRASHVEPSNGGWLVDLSPVNGPKFGPFARRDEALAFEVNWLNQHGIPTPKV